MRLAIFYFVGAIFVLVPLVFGFLLLPDVKPIDDWLYLHGLEWTFEPIFYVLISLPFLAAGAGWLVFERYIAGRLGDWLVNTLIPLRDNKR